jgi:hypothetical protein
MSPRSATNSMLIQCPIQFEKGSNRIGVLNRTEMLNLKGLVLISADIFQVLSLNQTTIF